MVSGILSSFEIFDVMSGTSVLDSNLTLTGSTTISGTLQIANGHTLTTGTGNGVTNQVNSGGTLDISLLADNTAGIGANGITIKVCGPGRKSHDDLTSTPPSSSLWEAVSLENITSDKGCARCGT